MTKKILLKTIIVMALVIFIFGCYQPVRTVKYEPSDIIHGSSVIRKESFRNIKPPEISIYDVFDLNKTKNIPISRDAGGNISTRNKFIYLEGVVSDDNGIYEITANGEEAKILDNGFFRIKVPLAIGENKIEIIATNKLHVRSLEKISIRRVSQLTKHIIARTVNLDTYIDSNFDIC